MSFRLNIQLRGDGIGKRLKTMAARLSDQGREKLLRGFGQILVSGAKRNIAEQHGPNGEVWKATRRGGEILRDTGLLMRSIVYRVAGRAVQIGSNLVYAAIHQFGGTIKPKNGQFLAIPLKGVARGAKPADFQDTFVRAGGDLATGKTGRALVMNRGRFESFTEGNQRAVIFQKTARGFRPLFLLLKSVTIPVRPYVGIGPKERQEMHDLARKHYLGEEAA